MKTRVNYAALAMLAPLLLHAAHVAADEAADEPPADTPAQVVKVPGKVVSSMRPYSRFAPGIREYYLHRHLAPQTELRFGLVTGTFPMKPLPLAKASLEAGWGWSQELTVLDDGWFLLPESPEAERKKADLVISQRKAYESSWVLDIHTPSLPPQTYRLGDLRLECRVYLAIEYGRWQGRRIMAKPTSSVTPPQMDALCGGTESIFFNTRPWPRLQAYVLSDGARTMRHELDGQKISTASFMLKLGSEADTQPWPDDALVEFVFYDNSYWSKPVSTAKADNKRD